MKFPILAVLFLLVPFSTFGQSTYVLPVIGQTRGAFAFYTGRVTVTNLSSSSNTIDVEQVFHEPGWMCRRQAFTRFLEPNETIEFTGVGCQGVAGAVLRSRHPLAVTIDIDETPFSGAPGTTQSIPVGERLFVAGSTVVIPHLEPITNSTREPVRANLFVFSPYQVLRHDATMTISARQKLYSGEVVTRERTVALTPGHMNVIPLEEVPADALTITVDAPFYAGVSVLQGSHGVFRSPYVKVAD